MRPLASRRLTVLAATAALTLGMVGPAVADELPPSAAADRAARAPLPDAAAPQAKEAAPAPLPETPAAPPVATGAKAAQAAPADPVDDALAAVEKAVAQLVTAVISGDAAGGVPQFTASLSSLVDAAVAAGLGSGLPAPDLDGLPALPALPVEVPELPVNPPADTPAQPPAAAPELPAPLSLPVG